MTNRSDTNGYRGSRNSNVTSWATVAGLVLLAAGLIGFLNTPLIGPQDNALVRADNVHNIVHLLTGAVALYIAFGLKGETQVNALIGFGVLYTVIFLSVLLSPNLFGLFSAPANASVHVIHAAVAVVSLVVGYMARSRATSTAR